LQNPDDPLGWGDFDELGPLPLLPREQKIVLPLARNTASRKRSFALMFFEKTG
jgi:hypothetical protein